MPASGRWRQHSLGRKACGRSWGEAHALIVVLRPREVQKAFPVEARKVYAHTLLATPHEDDDLVSGVPGVACPSDSSTLLQLADYLVNELLPS